MGRDKLPLKVGEIALIDRVARVLASRCEEVLIVGEGDHILAGTRQIPDLRPGRLGPLAGIEAGLSAARRRAVFVAAGDMPFLTDDLVEYMLHLLSERSHPKSRQGATGVENTPTPYSPLPTPRSEATQSEATLAVVPDFGGLHPLCAAYGREARPLVSAALDGGLRSVRGLLKDLPGVRYVGDMELRRFGDPEVLLANVNSPEDLVRVREVLRGG